MRNFVLCVSAAVDDILRNVEGAWFDLRKTKGINGFMLMIY